MTEEVYKGCSTFVIEDVDIRCDVAHNITIDGHVGEYGVCKQTCNGENCNMEHVRPCVPHAGEDCLPDNNRAGETSLSFLFLLILYFLL